MSDEILKDIVAAQADLKGRLEQSQIETEEKLYQLTELESALKAGTLSTKVVQQRVRQVISERSDGALQLRSGSSSAGGFSARAQMKPRTSPAAAKTGGPQRLTSTLVSANLGQLQKSIEQYIIRLLLREEQGSARSNAHRLELALLVDTYRCIEKNLIELPENAGLLSHLDEFFHDTQALIRDLGDGGGGRICRIVSYNRQLVSELSVLGGQVGSLKDILSKRAKMVATANLEREDEVLNEMGSIYQKLRQELDRRGKKTHTSLMEKVLA